MLLTLLGFLLVLLLCQAQGHRTFHTDIANEYCTLEKNIKTCNFSDFAGSVELRVSGRETKNETKLVIISAARVEIPQMLPDQYENVTIFDSKSVFTLITHGEANNDQVSKLRLNLFNSEAGLIDINAIYLKSEGSEIKELFLPHLEEADIISSRIGTLNIKTSSKRSRIWHNVIDKLHIHAKNKSYLDIKNSTINTICSLIIDNGELNVTPTTVITNSTLLEIQNRGIDILSGSLQMKNTTVHSSHEGSIKIAGGFLYFDGGPNHVLQESIKEDSVEIVSPGKLIEARYTDKKKHAYNITVDPPLVADDVLTVFDEIVFIQPHQLTLNAIIIGGVLGGISLILIAVIIYLWRTYCKLSYNKLTSEGTNLDLKMEIGKETPKKNQNNYLLRNESKQPPTIQPAYDVSTPLPKQLNYGAGDNSKATINFPKPQNNTTNRDNEVNLNRQNYNPSSSISAVDHDKLNEQKSFENEEYDELAPSGDSSHARFSTNRMRQSLSDQDEYDDIAPKGKYSDRKISPPIRSLVKEKKAIFSDVGVPKPSLPLPRIPSKPNRLPIKPKSHLHNKQWSNETVNTNQQTFEKPPNFSSPQNHTKLKTEPSFDEDEIYDEI